MVSLSFSTFSCLRMPVLDETKPSVVWPLETVLSGVAAAGIELVGLDMFTVQEYSRRGWTTADIGGLLDGADLACSDVGALIVGEHAETVAAAEQLAGIAAATGARHCTTAMWVVPDRAAIETLRQCSDVLAGCDVRMALEFCPYTPLPTLRETRLVCAAVGWDRCGVLVDSWHFFRGDADFDELELLSADQIAYVQFNDAPPPISGDLQHESRHRRLPPGDGTFDLGRFTDAILDTGFAGVVSLEVLADDFHLLEPNEQGRLARGSLERYWGVSQPIG